MHIMLYFHCKELKQPQKKGVKSEIFNKHLQRRRFLWERDF